MGTGHTETNRCVSVALVTYSAADQGGDHVEVANEVLGIEVSRSRRCLEEELAERVSLIIEKRSAVKLKLRFKRVHPEMLGACHSSASSRTAATGPHGRNPVLPSIQKLLHSQLTSRIRAALIPESANFTLWLA